MELLWHWRSQRYEITTRIHVLKLEAETRKPADLVELGTLLHARAQAKLDEAVAAHDAIRAKYLPRPAKKGAVPPRTVLEADEVELPEPLLESLLDMVRQASSVKPLPAVEKVRTAIRAGLIARYQELGLAVPGTL